MKTKASPAMSQTAIIGGPKMSNVSQASVHGANHMTVRYRYCLRPRPNSKVRDLVVFKFIINPTTNLVVSQQRVRRTSGDKIIDIISALIHYARSQRNLGTEKFSATIRGLFDYLRGGGLISTQVKFYNFYDVVRFLTRLLPELKISRGNPSVATVGGISCTNVGFFLYHLHLLRLLYQQD
jgi:hypothetical protein